MERLFDQLRQRRLAEEQVGTFRKREEAAAKLRELKDAEAAAEKQTELTQTRIEVEVEQNRGDAALARAERLARRDVARAEGRSRSRELLGKGDAARIAQTGLAEAEVFAQKVKSFGDARLFALGSALAELARSSQPLVPERLFVLGGTALPAAAARERRRAAACSVSWSRCCSPSAPAWGREATLRPGADRGTDRLGARRRVRARGLVCDDGNRWLRQQAARVQTAA
jgi:hypothetical protein